MGKRFLFSVVILFVLLPVRARSQQAAPSIVWQKCLGGSGNDQANTLVRTPDGGYLVAGYSLSNDGDVSGHHGSIDSMDAWVVKLSSTGSIQWQKSIGGSGSDVITHMIPTSDGNYIGIGYTTSNDGDVTGNHAVGLQDVMVVKLDRNGNILWLKCFGGSLNEYGVSIRQTADGGYIFAGNTLSNDGDVSGNPPLSGGYPQSAAWVVKLDASGNLVWRGCYGQAYGPMAHDILPLADGTYVLGLTTNGDNYSNQGLFSTGGNPPLPFLAKIGPTSQLLETQCPGIQRANVYGFVPINNLQYYFVENLLYCYPGSPNNGLAFYRNDTTVSNNNTNTSLLDVFGTCPPPSSPFIYGYNVKGPGSMVVTGLGTGVAAGTTSDTLARSGLAPNVNFSIRLGNHGGNRDGLVTTFSPTAWAKCYGGSADDVFQGLVSVGDSVYVAAGFTNSNDGDVTGNHGGYDFWVVSMSKTNSIRGSVYMDYNANGVRDAGEPLVNDILVQTAKGGSLSGSMTYNGFYSNSVDTGTYTTHVISALPYYTSTPASHTSVFSTYNNTDTISFGLQPIPGKRDYLVNQSPLSQARPGFAGHYQVECVNAGTDTLVNRTVEWIRDPRIIYQSAVPSPTSVSGDTLRWTIAALSPRDTTVIRINIQFAAPPLLNIGDTVVSTALIDTTGDLNPANNSYTANQLVYGSFDPNGKEEANGGIVYTNDLGKGKYLLYTIHFQNTGTDTAFKVVVTDTLSSRLDPTTLEMTGASAPYALNTTNGNILTWTFSNIRLPDSMVNVAGSQGWLSFRIKPVTGIAAGDSIVNTADIYFDFNLPVATKSVVTEVRTASAPPALPAPGKPVMTGLDSSYCSLVLAARITLSNVPPASDSAVVWVSLDGRAISVNGGGGFALQPAALSPGPHGLVAVYANRIESDTLVAGFSVVKAATPAVGLSSSTYTITATTGNVVLTASDLSGGGSTPLFTFAKDRGFSSVFRTEGPDSVLTLAATAFAIGNNPVYVRMRTSDTCYTVATAIDSISIAEAAPDTLPQAALRVDPNPFTDQLHVTGLKSTDVYSVSLLNSVGMEVYETRVAGATGEVLYTGRYPAGVYLVRVFDETTGRLVRLVKLESTGSR